MRSHSLALVLLPVFWPNLPPLNLALLKGFLIKNGISVDTFDFNNYFFSRAGNELRAAWKRSCNRALEKNMPDILKSEFRHGFQAMIGCLLEYETVGFSCYKSNYTVVQKVAAMLKAEKPCIRVVLGGPEVARRYFKSGGSPATGEDCADFRVVGEGELPLLRFLRSARKGGQTAFFEELRGEDLAVVPDYTDFDTVSYPRTDSVSVLLSRGCIRKCAFCAERLLYKKFRVCPVGTVIETIGVYRKKGMQNFIFHDSLINGDLSALEKLCDGIIGKFGAVNWEAQIAVRRDMPDRLFRRIKESGCYHLFVGLESGSDSMLRAMRKGFRARDAADFFRRMRGAGLSFGVSLITGFPGETAAHFEESLDFLMRHKDVIPKIEQVNPFIYYDGTGMPEDADYKRCPASLEKARIFVERIQAAGFKYTNAFLMNLVEKRTDA